MPIRNEIIIGVDAKYNGMTMFRKVDNVPFNPQFLFNDDDTLNIGSNITVNYIEYYKNSVGDIISELTKHKYYVVPNITELSHIETIIDTPAVLDQYGIEITPAITHPLQVIDRIAWMASNRWFMSVARTPILAPYGIMDGIEGTLKLLPMETANGYILTGPLS